MLIYRNAEGVHGQRQFGNPCTKAKDLKLILYDKQLLCPWPYR